jgi:CRP-like cAMP-binding protein
MYVLGATRRQRDEHYVRSRTDAPPVARVQSTGVVSMRLKRLQTMDSSASPMDNELLAALPSAAYRRLLPHLRATTLRTGQTLFRSANSLLYAYFPTNSIVTLSYAIDEGDAMAKAWPVGREGMVGISFFLGSPHRPAEVQIGGLAFRLPVAALLAEFRRAGAFHRLLLRYVSALVTQASQLSVCSHCHQIEQRLCRFLLSMFDRVSGDEVEITHERTAALLGVRRESMSRAARLLQAARVVEFLQGRVRLISREKLAKRACACAAIIRRAFQAVAKTGVAAPQRRIRPAGAK